MEPCNRSGAVDELRVHRPLLLLSTTTSTTTTISATTTHMELSAALGTFFVFLTAVLLFFFLWLYSRYCVHGQTAARTARGRRMLMQLQQQQQGLRRHSSSADGPCTPEPALSTLLPAVAYSTVEGKAQDCAICLSEYEGKDMVKVIPCCGHVFHQECIDRWLDSHGSCPVCRRTEILSGSGSGSGGDACQKDRDLSLQIGSMDTADAQVTPSTNT